MEPIKFSEYCQVLKGTGDLEDLPVLGTNYDGLGPALISCWQLSWRDLLTLVFTRKIYVCVLGMKHQAMQLNVSPDDLGVPETEAYWREERDVH